MPKERVRVTPDVRAKAVGEIQNGKSRQIVADELGVSLAAVHLWMSKANQEAYPTRSEASELRVLPMEAGAPPPQTSDLEKKIKLLELEIQYLKQRLAIYESE